MEPGQDAEIQVKWEDQHNINLFSRLNNQLSDLEDEYEEVKKEKEYLDDLISTELELMDEEEDSIRYKIGGAFVLLPVGQVKEKLETEHKVLVQDLDTKSKKMADIHEQMNRLKVILYTKFGSVSLWQKE